MEGGGGGSERQAHLPGEGAQMSGECEYSLHVFVHLYIHNHDIT